MDFSFRAFFLTFCSFSAKIQLYLTQENVNESDDLLIKSTKTSQIRNKTVIIVEASTKILEDPKYQREYSTVSILYEKIPNMIELLPDQTVVEFTWIMVIKQNVSDIENIFNELHQNAFDLLRTHTNEWQQFWTNKQLSTEGNELLSNAIDASIYGLASALPSLNSSRPREKYFGLSPAGLGLNRNLEVYNGHSFWDTEIWIHPTILLIEPEWSKELLNYRHFLRNTAEDNAVNTSYKGLRFCLHFLS